MVQVNRKLRYTFLVVMILTGLLFSAPPDASANWAAGIKNKLSPQLTTARDDKGVWYIKGDKNASLFDVFEHMGYAVATDRLWQAEKYRRMGRGRLAEVFGPSQLASDIQVRTTGYSDQEYKDGFAALDQESKDTINGYVAGFNRRIAEVRKDRSLLPIEFKMIGGALGIDFVPEDWTPTDVLAWATSLLRFFDGEATTRGQLDNFALYQGLAAKFPADFQLMFQDLRWLDDPDAVTYIADETQVASAAAAKSPAKTGKTGPAGISLAAKEMVSSPYDFKKIAHKMKRNQEEIVANLKKINAYVKMGSYAWVVSGKKTASGNPIIYSGPQMDHAFKFSVPSIVAEGSIKAGSLDISGMVIPGLPAIVIGRTPHHAWSMQVGHAHTLDYFLDNPATIKLNRVEIIKVAGQADVQLPVFRTPHGPVVNADPVISWKYAHWGHEFEIVGTYLALARAQSMDQFGAAIRKVSLSQHYCYADRDGNIAYWMSGFDPVRVPESDTRFPQMVDWPEPVTLKPLATDRNAARGYYCGWNSRASHSYANSANNPSYYFGPFHRAHIIDDYLSSHDNLTFEDVRNLALYIATTDSIREEFLASNHDSYGDGGNPWKFVKADFTAAVQNAPTDSRNAALAMLADWDGHFVAGGPEKWASSPDRADAWILMNEWITEALNLTFNDELAGIDEGERKVLLFNVMLHGLPGYPTSITNYYDWFSNKVNATAPQTAPDIIVAALDKALAKLGARPWGIGKRGKITYNHEIFGDIHSLPTSSRSTYAHCVEMGPTGPVRIESMFPLGESGTILSGPTGIPAFDPNYFGMVPVYDGFQHRNFPVK